VHENIQRFGRWVGWTGFVLWACALWGLSSLPPREVASFSFPHADKILHFVYFAAGGFLFTWALACTFRWRPIAVKGLSLGMILAIGISDEWHQTFTPGRQGADIFDFVADVTGGLSGIIVARWLYEWIKRKIPAGTGQLAPTGD
jgi:VanZ family protein